MADDFAIKKMRDFLGTRIALMREQMSKGGAPPNSNMNASGQSRRAFRFTIKTTATEVIGIIYGPEHVEYLERGRGPGKAPPRSAIREWIDHKGIVPRDGISKDSLAFLIQRKIKQRGTRMHARRHRSGILSKTVNRRQLQGFFKEVTNAKRLELRSSLSEKLRDINPER